MRIAIPITTLTMLVLTTVGTNAQVIEPRDCAEIKKQAEQTMRRFGLLLNQIADPVFFSSEREELILNSFAPDNPGRIFFNSSVIIEDDLRPVLEAGTSPGLNDKKVDKYLHDFDLMYSKQEQETVFFSNLHFGPIQANGFTFVHLIYDSVFKGLSKDPSDSTRYKRVATIRAVKTEGQWTTYLQQVNFYRPEYAFVANYVDSDCDGIRDPEDDCPAEAGSAKYDGCPPPPDPDTDEDGMTDQIDQCPEEMGPWCNFGCPLEKDRDPLENRVLWQELYGNDGPDVIFDINNNDQGEVIFAGETEIPGSGRQLYMAILDPCRKNISNRLVLGGPQEDGARKVIQIAPGQYALVGYTESNGSGSRDGWLVFTDGMQMTGEKFFGGSRTFDEFTDIAMGPAGDLFIAGHKDGRIWLLQAGCEGNLLKEVVYPESENARCTALTLSPAGEIFLTGYETSGNKTSLLVLRYDRERERLTEIHKIENGQGWDILVDREENLVITGSIYSRRTREDILVIRLDRSGKSLWKEAHTFAGAGVDVGRSIFETKNGNFLLAGYSSSYADGARREKLWANLLSKTGVPLWEEPLFFGNRLSDRAYSTTQIEANSIIIAGSTNSSFSTRKAHNTDFWLVGIKVLE